MKTIAIIGGTGMENAPGIAEFTKKIIDTPYGQALCHIGEIKGKQVIFLSRHGVDHSTLPHKVNYRANIWALKSLGTEEIFTTTAVGSLRKDYAIGDFVICDNILDFTKSRISTFYDDSAHGVGHVNCTDPFCPELRQKVIGCMEKLGYSHHTTGTYVCTEGPRFETRAEIKMFASLGGDVVGMTCVPEAFLAREAEICYTACAIVTNMGAGISDRPVSLSEVTECMTESVEKLKAVIVAYLNAEDKQKACGCDKIMEEFGGFKL